MAADAIHFNQVHAPTCIERCDGIVICLRGRLGRIGTKIIWIPRARLTDIGGVRSVHGEWTIGDGGTGPVAKSLRDELVGIQYGRKPDRYGWMHKLA